MAPKYKLTYFDVAGLAEQIRFLLSYGGLEFEDVRISRESWPALKSSAPLGQVPILEVDGKVLFQSVAIDRYLGHLVGLAGKTPLENWEIDAVADTLTDLKHKLVGWNMEEDGPKKDKDRETLLKETVPFNMSKFEAWAAANGGYLALGRLTWIDIVFIPMFEVFDKFIAAKFGLPSFLDGYPNLQKLHDTVMNLPSIKAWVARRPPDQPNFS